MMMYCAHVNRCNIDVSLNETREPVAGHYKPRTRAPFDRAAVTSTPASGSRAESSPRLRHSPLDHAFDSPFRNHVVINHVFPPSLPPIS